MKYQLLAPIFFLLAIDPTQKGSICLKPPGNH